jgi:hypothetical protein
MKLLLPIALLSATAVALVPLAAALPTADASAIAALLADAGYPEVREIEFEDGLWEAEVRRGNGLWGEVAVDPSNGEIFDTLAERDFLSLEQIRAALDAAGYSAVHDLDRDGALWEADATGADGQAWELRISGYDGRVLHATVDQDED